MRRIGLKIAVLLTAFLIAMLGIVLSAAFLSLALYHYFLTMLTAPLAGLATGAAVLAICLLLAFLLVAVSRLPSRKQKRPANAEMLMLLEEHLLSLGVGSVVARKLRALGSRHPFALTTGFAVAGLVLGWSPRLRAFLRDLG